MPAEAQALGELRAAVLRGDWTGAARAATAGLAEHADSLELRRALAGIHRQSGRMADAEALLREVLARESGDNLELFFFPRLRSELHLRLQQSPRVLHFRGLRGCVKQIAGARRWSPRCEQIQDQIVDFLRSCLNAEPEPSECALVVE